MSPQQAVLKGLSWRHAARMYFGASRASTTRTVLGTNARWQSAFQSYSSAAKHVFSRAANGFASKEELQFTKEPQIAEEVVPDREADAPLTSQINPTLSDDTRYTFDPIFLRDCCSCERCVDPSTTQKTFETADIPLNIRAASVDVQHDGSTQIRWEPDLPGFEDHVSIYDASFRDRNRNLKSRLEATYNLQGQRIPWDCKLMKQSKMSVEYGNYMDSSAALLSSLQHLYRYGLLFIHSVPANPDSVASIANRIGPIKQTFYGPTWDVKSVPSAKNVAYTSSHLGFHVVRPKHIVSTNGPTKQPEQDLPYVDNPAGLQILHCLEASSRGGESLFSDALRAVKKIEQSRPDHYFTLENFPVTYKYHNNVSYLP